MRVRFPQQFIQDRLTQFWRFLTEAFFGCLPMARERSYGESLLHLPDDFFEALKNSMILQCRVITSCSEYSNQVYFFILELMVKECSEDIRSRGVHCAC